MAGPVLSIKPELDAILQEKLERQRAVALERMARYAPRDDRPAEQEEFKERARTSRANRENQVLFLYHDRTGTCSSTKRNATAAQNDLIRISSSWKPHGPSCPPGAIHPPDASDLLPGAHPEAPPDATPSFAVPNPLWMPHLFSRAQSVTHCNSSKARSSNSAAPSNAGTLERLENLDTLTSADTEKAGFSALLKFRKALHACHP
ncbi:hypothetical protein DFH09DRAFT_1338552 [Mycena vulgaris]|nr:hypothetical protein DFH09DRAFT_1338552 [Mycena vulgaris]